MFFEEKEGKKYVRAMGKELALRMFDARFGILSKQQQKDGEKRARLGTFKRKQRRHFGRSTMSTRN